MYVRVTTKGYFNWFNITVIIIFVIINNNKSISTYNNKTGLKKINQPNIDYDVDVECI